jgi:hypothetical protein
MTGWHRTGRLHDPGRRASEPRGRQVSARHACHSRTALVSRAPAWQLAWASPRAPLEPRRARIESPCLVACVHGDSIHARRAQVRRLGLRHVLRADGPRRRGGDPLWGAHVRARRVHGDFRVPPPRRSPASRPEIPWPGWEFPTLLRAGRLSCDAEPEILAWLRIPYVFVSWSAEL